jgi:hypothetical protein
MLLMFVKRILLYAYSIPTFSILVIVKIHPSLENAIETEETYSPIETVKLKKNLWKSIIITGDSYVFCRGEFVSGSNGALAHGYKLDWGFSVLEHYFSDYTDLIRGKILDPEIEEVSIKTKDGNLFKANLIEYNNDEKFWFLVSDGEDLVGSTITGLSSDGKIIEQITK